MKMVSMKKLHQIWGEHTDKPNKNEHWTKMKRQKAMLNKKIMQSEKIQSPYSWATIIRTIPLRFRFPNCLPPQKDDIWGSGGGESPTKLKLEDYRAQQHTEWVRLVHCYFRTKILNRWYQIEESQEMKNAHKKHKETLKWITSKWLTSRPRTTIKPVSWVYLAIKQ